LLAVVFWIILERTVFGRYVRAVGDNEVASLYTGLPIRKTKTVVYLLTGLLTGVAGVIYTAENHQGNPNAGVAYELDAIAAVVIGGTSLAGGSGSIGGTVVGTLIMGILTNILRLKNVDSNVEMMVKAVIIVLAVAIQKQRKTA
jgi:ribose transport system permease protein